MHTLTDLPLFSIFTNPSGCTTLTPLKALERVLQTPPSMAHGCQLDSPAGTSAVPKELVIPAHSIHSRPPLGTHSSARLCREKGRVSFPGLLGAELPLAESPLAAGQ